MLLLGMGLYSLAKLLVITSVATASAFFSKILYDEWLKQRIPKKWEKLASVKKLYLYPLKSGRRRILKEAECTKTGLREKKKSDNELQLRDRKLVLYNVEHNEFITPRNYPQIVLIEVSVHEQDVLAIEAPTMPILNVKIPNRKDNVLVNVKCWYGERIFGIDCGDEAATWFSRYILEKDSGVRLAYNDMKSDEIDLLKPLKYITSYYKSWKNDDPSPLCMDLASVHLISTVSVKDMNEKNGGTKIGPEFFRPNIVIDDMVLAPYVEEKWEWIKIGDNVIMKNVRNNKVTVDSETGIVDAEKEPLKIFELEENPEKTPIVGIYLSVKQCGLIKEGDPIYVGTSE